MKHAKRILSFALVLVMVLSCMPIQALAAENAETAYVAINKTTGKGYESLLVAMSECRKGETVALQKDASEMQVLVPADGILDLNGCTLEAEYMSCFGDLIDSSDDNSGLLKVNEDYFLIRGDNKQLPIKDGTGFRFVEITKINTKMLTPTKFVFQPLFEAAALDLIAKGGDVTGLTVQVLVGWKQNDGYRTQEFVYNDDLLTQFLGSYNAATGKYGKMFTLTLNNVDGIEELSFAAVLASSTKVTISSATEKEEVTGNVTTDANNQVVDQVVLDNGSASAVVSTGTQLVGGTNKVTLSATEMEKTTSNVTLGANEKMQSMNVHVEGVSVENTVPILVTLDKLAPEFLNQGNLKLYHVENGETVEMTRVYSLAEVDAHNEFYYDIATGTVTMALATFSEIAVVSDTTKAWAGKFDYTWYTNAVAPVDGEAVTEYVIANADQLAALSAIVGGMNGQTQDSFAGKTVKLIADINLGDKESENNPDIIFYPIGYYNSEGTYERTNKAITSGLRNFEGTFDGNGHTVSNFYQNTWEMKGDHNWYTPEEQYYRDGMGLFGRVYGGTIKNLTVKNFSSDGEIATTGTIAAYAEGATFENISIFNCNPRVYNIGNGGIVGCVGWYAKEAGLKTTFSNITVDNSNKISALWGSYDVACGGIVGQYYPTSGQSSANYPVNAGIHFENCHVAAQMDVYNDVCANYQYYAYRYTGMLIGSIRENVTENGHSYPKMDGITASGCTVHFGDWNDYYYCELVANSLASYTHDHQMSRLTQVASVDAANKTVTTLDGKTIAIPAGRVNYVVVKAKDANGAWIHGDGHAYAECYHFVDGVQHFHDVADADNTEVYEMVDGVQTLKEDKQLIYREFNQLFTGYGWGVTSKGLTDYEGVENMDITHSDAEASVDKFQINGEDNKIFNKGDQVTIGDLFVAIQNAGVAIQSANVQVFVSPVGEGSTASGTYAANTSDWTQGTLTFSGEGAAIVTITDYHYCKTATLNITVKDRQPVVKFNKKFDKDFLYRVGNKNAVNRSYLFEEIASITGTVAVEITNVKGNAGGTYANNSFSFTGTGVVKVTITDNDYCIATELLLEVIDATNITSNVGTTTGGTFVMVSDINTSSYVNYWYCTLYGNGFTYSLKNAPTDYNSKQGHGVLILDGATFDNVKVEGDIYTQYGAFTTNAQYNAAIDIKGDSTIQNCWIANCAAPITIRSTGATIKNTTLYGGAVANLIINSGKVILEDVTTVNFADGRSMVGMGIVIHSDANDTAKLVLNGKLEQYNFIPENMNVTDTYAKNLFSAMFNSDCGGYHFGSNPRYVNTGIISLTETFNAEDITDNRETGYRYIGTAVSLSGYDGYVYTQPNTVGSVDNNYNKTSDPHYGTTQGAVPPSYDFDYTDKNYIPKKDSSNDYCYFEGGKVNISMDQGDTFNWDTSILDVSKAGSTLQYKVTMNGVDYTGKSIAFNTAGEYTVEYTYTDGNNYYLDANGNLSTYAANYTKTVIIIVAVVEAATKHAEFTFGSNNTASTTVTIGNNTYVMPNVNATSSTFGKTADGIYYPIVEIIMSDGKTSHSSGWYAYFPVFSGAVTIQDYADQGKGDKMTPYNANTTTMPNNLSVVGSPDQLFKYQSKSAAGTTPVVKNSKLVFSSAKIEADRSEYNTVIQYSYTDNAGATFYYYIGYHAPAQSYSNTCVTGDTMVTLADGSTKRIDQVSSTDLLLVWNFFEGKYDVAPAAVIFDHGSSYSKVVALTFSDGTTVKIVNMHQFFDTDLNQFVSITAENVADFVGHKYASLNGNVELVSYAITEEYVDAWGVMTALHYNIFVEGMLSTDFELKDADLFHYFQVGENMKFDEVQMQADIEKYGLYTYEDFADYLTYEQFVAFNAQYLKIPVSKGLYTFEGILKLINTYL